MLASMSGYSPACLSAFLLAYQSAFIYVCRLGVFVCSVYWLVGLPDTLFVHLSAWLSTGLLFYVSASLPAGLLPCLSLPLTQNDVIQHIFVGLDIPLSRWTIFFLLSIVAINFPCVTWWSLASCLGSEGILTLLGFLGPPDDANYREWDDILKAVGLFLGEQG